ncbi:MAG: glutamate 5-kinase [Sphingomonas sp.]|uniref:glutamate 5-kinase n=1 Tax=Sphingomonas sp. TaxID=28214 RepID=UPI0025DD2B05|nr:glutamate 5-kinase [Sphingomonas sp.]MBX9881797.1 glutamate 5-kinase [Sphingomonas sp.]
MLLNAPRLVVKIGSSLLIGERGGVRRDWLATVAADVAALAGQGQQVVIVSSGAIALGARRLKLAKGGRATLEDAQAAAATGQIALARAWAEALGAEGLTAAQLLLTLDDLEDRRRYLNAATTLARLLSLGVVPVINENDSVATEEIRFGDNDRLAARVALAGGAQAVLLLSDVDGLYDRPPEEAGAVLIPEVTALDTLAARIGAVGAMGTGGMAAKLAAARLATGAGVALAIASGREEHPLARFTETRRGTLFTPAADAAPARKAWLAAGLTAKGQLVADAGAVVALRQGKSLLPAGVIGVRGKFLRGDLVVILDDRGTPIARGLSEYDAEEAARIAGERSESVAAILGHAPRAALVHRNHMALL